MIHLSLDALRLVAKNRGIKDYENKSEEDLIKILSESKTKITIPKKKIKEIKKYFSKHKFSKSEINKFSKSLYDINHRNLSLAEVRDTEKNLVELENSLQFKNYHNYDDDDEYKKSIRRLFKPFNRDYYKPIKTVYSFDDKKNGYIEYRSIGDKYENLSPEKYLDMIRPYLINMINDHKTPLRLPNNETKENGKFS